MVCPYNHAHASPCPYGTRRWIEVAQGLPLDPAALPFISINSSKGRDVTRRTSRTVCRKITASLTVRAGVR